MIRDTFETNPGLCELFKRKIIERARSVGLGEDVIDFESHIDVKGTYQDNLRAFYREYPQLSRDSDYYRIRSIRPLSGAALEQAWLGYEQNNGHETPEPIREATGQPPTAEVILPELVITYTFGAESAIGPKPRPGGRGPVSTEPVIEQAGTDSAASIHSELARSILNRVSAMAGEKVVKMILHQIGQEIGSTAYNDANQTTVHNPTEALDHALSIRGLGRVLSLDETDDGPGVTYVCSVIGCHTGVSPSPTCDIARGVVSRWLESFVRKKAESIKTNSASGSEPCVIRVTFRK